MKVQAIIKEKKSEPLIDLLISLIRYAVFGTGAEKLLEIDISAEQMTKLYRISKAHDLAHLVSSALSKLGRLSDDELSFSFEKQQMKAVTRYERMSRTLSKICDALEKVEIPFIPLKGAVIREYYPEPFMRTSGDIDLLVHEDDLEGARRIFVEELEFEFVHKGTHDMIFLTPNQVNIELHFSLIEENRVNSADKPLADVWNNATVVDGKKYQYKLTDDMFYYYHIAHMAKHFVSGGCGIKPFIDIYILNHSVDFDREAINEKLNHGGLYDFSKHAEGLSEVWFGEEKHSDLTLQMQAFLILGGVHGVMSNRIAVERATNKSKLSYAMSRIILPYDVLKYYYPVLEMHKWLLPLCQVRRWFKVLFFGGVGRSVKELKTNNDISKDETKVLQEFLSNLGLRK